ncbi:SAM-dependent methyltransferase [Streptomyces sp. XM4193]|uniref:SAM-dependent methyltransferase n=1 Tax=Streptomyces sp. XM4193 TaxID=2929782 RepID=UPI001FF977E6|nr:SAM-dependent methyltransferase [Streptomyces sp. XM4193]MCK1797335.1 SAM-dependent methyltransferase [Streptomyces sp. XM4193]
MERPDWAPQGIDLSRPSVSRIYDFYLGGSHNFEVDREAGRKAIVAFPGLPKIMQANRAFMRRAVRHAASRGVTQFLDIGSGIPTFGNVHEVAQEANPDSRVVYVDNDPVAVAHSRAVLKGNTNAAVLSADFRAPQDILNSPEVRAQLDLDKPVALLLVALLHFIQNSEEPAKTIETFHQALPSGSFLVLTHASTDGGPRTSEEGDRIQDVYRNASSQLVMRSRSEVEALFGGFTIEEPGIVAMPNWRPDGPVDNDDPVIFTGFAGVGRKA